MNRYLQMLIFAVVLGTITSTLLLGMDTLTRDRIAANQEVGLKSAILDAYDIDYTFANINEVFDEEIDLVTYDNLNYYINKDTNQISFEFEGNGLWGPITGVITIDEDFETILNIKVLEQEETPGLGGVVADSDYLAKFIGKVFNIDISKEADPLNENQVDSITGATGTSNAFEIIINNTYDQYKSVWDLNIE